MSFGVIAAQRKGSRNRCRRARRIGLGRGDLHGPGSRGRARFRQRRRDADRAADGLEAVRALRPGLPARPAKILSRPRGAAARRRPAPGRGWRGSAASLSSSSSAGFGLKPNRRASRIGAMRCAANSRAALGEIGLCQGKAARAACRRAADARCGRPGKPAPVDRGSCAANAARCRRPYARKASLRSDRNQRPRVGASGPLRAPCRAAPQG